MRNIVWKMHALEKPEQPSVHCSCVTSWQAHHSEVGNDCTQNRKVYMSKTEDNFCVKSLWKKGTYFMGNGHDSQVDLTSLQCFRGEFWQFKPTNPTLHVIYLLSQPCGDCLCPFVGQHLQTENFSAEGVCYAINIKSEWLGQFLVTISRPQPIGTLK